MPTNSLRALLTRHAGLPLYLAKCVAGAAGIVLVSQHYGYAEEFWCLISFLLVLTPDSAEAVPLALTRMKANLCGASGALLAVVFSAPQIATLVIAIVFTGVLCSLWKVMSSCRVAMAAAVIVLNHAPGPHLWDNALQRLIAVFLGCLLGLIITLIFHRRLPGVPALEI